jgi:outer membrane protein OmpA-like peptidoglycan-associated protein
MRFCKAAALPAIGKPITPRIPIMCCAVPALSCNRRVVQPPGGVTLEFAEESGSGVLSANGIASQNWIDEARRLARLLPAVDRFDTEQLLDLESVDKEFQAAKEQIENAEIPFDSGSAKLPADQSVVLNRLAQEIKKLQQIAQISGRSVRVEVYGFADNSGSEAVNQKLEQERAATVWSTLRETGIASDRMVVGARDSRQRLNDRKVTFKVILPDAVDRTR